MTLEDLLKREEGFTPYCYLDHLGYQTIGYGKLIDRRGGGITEEEALYLLRNEVTENAEALRKAIPWISKLNEDRRTILQAMAFQLGVSGLLAFRKTLEAVKSGDYVMAAKGMRGSKWATQTPGRAERMAKGMESGTLDVP